MSPAGVLVEALRGPPDDDEALDDLAGLSPERVQRAMVRELRRSRRRLDWLAGLMALHVVVSVGGPAAARALGLGA